MKITTKGRYALLIMSDIAKNKDGYTSLNEISTNNNISLKYLEKIMSLLRKAKFVESSRGAEGGYKLTRKPEEYTIAEILTVAEGNIAPVKCVLDDSCPSKNSCKSYPFWKEYYDNENAFLSKKTLKDFM
jgi:Rrf2 family protein